LPVVDDSDEGDGIEAVSKDGERSQLRGLGSAVALSNMALRRISAIHSQLDALPSPRLPRTLERLLRTQESITKSISNDMAMLTRGINAALGNYAVIEPAIVSAVRAAAQAGSFALSPTVLEQVRQIQARHEQLLGQLHTAFPPKGLADHLLEQFKEFESIRSSVLLDQLPNFSKLAQLYATVLQEQTLEEQAAPSEVESTDVTAAPAWTAETPQKRLDTNPVSANYVVLLSIFIMLFQTYLDYVGSNRLLAELHQSKEEQHEDSQRTQELLEQEVAAPLQQIEEFTGAILSLLLAESNGEEPSLGLVAVREAPVRSAPSSEAAEISRVSPGQDVRVVSREGTWLYVGLFSENDETIRLGWVNKRHLKLYPDAGATTTGISAKRANRFPQSLTR
jgi:hypothetical protein